MVTDKQQHANQVNALSSTGPQTPEGKEVSKMNALKHGLLSREVLLDDENEEELLEFEKRLRGCIKPRGELEQLLTDKIIAYAWRLRRVMSVERAIMELEKSSSIKSMFPDEKNEKRNQKIGMRDMIANDEIEKITRYEVTIVKHFYKALHELLRIQALQRGDKSPLPVAVDIDGD